MRRSPRHAGRTLIAAVLLGAGLPAASRSQDMTTPMDTKGQLLMWITDAEDKLLQLADITPEAAFAWRPGADVRSTGEVFMHVAAANYGLPGFAGVQPPAGFDFMTYEKSLTGKADIRKALEDSFGHMKRALDGMSEAELQKQVEISFIGMKTNVQGIYMLLLSHAHEHLGQSIAYARSNGIAPPWTARQNEAFRARMEEAGAAK